MDFDQYFDALYVARLSKDHTGALAKLAGGADAPQVQPLESGEWDAEVRHGATITDDGTMMAGCHVYGP